MNQIAPRHFLVDSSTPQNARLLIRTSSGDDLKHTTNSKNLIIESSHSILTLMVQLRHCIDHHDIETLHSQIVSEINRVRTILTRADYPQTTVNAASYCLCTALDEAVLKQSWGVNSSWSQQSLLATFHNETWGGKRFYFLIDELSHDISRHIELFEFIYLLLSLGFEGKLYGKNDILREEIRNRIYYQIRNAKPKPSHVINDRWLKQKIQIKSAHRTFTLKRLMSVSLALLMSLIIIVNVILAYQTSNIRHALANSAKVSPIMTFSRLTLRHLSFGKHIRGQHEHK